MTRLSLPSRGRGPASVMSKRPRRSTSAAAIARKRTRAPPSGLGGLDLPPDLWVSEIVCRLPLHAALLLGETCRTLHALVPLGVHTLEEWDYLASDAVLTRFSCLRTLNLTNVSRDDVTDAALVRLAPHLTRLTLFNQRVVSDAALVQLSRLTCLKLETATTIQAASVTALPCLTSLNLYGDDPDPGELGDALLQSLAPRLTTLRLDNVFHFTDAGVAPLVHLTTLKLVSDELITDAALAQLPHLTHLNLRDNYAITGAAFGHLSRLTRLNLDDNNFITDAALAALPQLTWLSLDNNDVITRKGLLHLTHLERLSLRLNRMIKMETLTHLPRLQRVVLTRADHLNNFLVYSMLKQRGVHVIKQ